MKKWLILSAALLLALAGAVKLSRHGSYGSSGSTPGQPAAPGAPAPDGDTRYSIPEEFSAVPARSGARSSYGALPTIKNKSYDKGPCKGGSLNEIFSAHGRVWGYLSAYGSFLEEHNAATYDLLARYLSCVGLARGDPAFCDYLPGESRGGRAVITREGSPNYLCGQYYRSVSSLTAAGGACPEGLGGLCSAFSAKSEASCSALLSKTGSAYCGYLAKAQKRAGGYAGFSPEEVKAAIGKEEEDKAEAERLRRENERITEEVNARVRKLLGRRESAPETP
ncbi:MAG: hypothetical protein HY550_12385 [Elusimicrobia bacterium]|nr:hypothetical protein [Elusimicrobiota bacterium]